MFEGSQTRFVNHILTLLMQHQQGDNAFKSILRQKANEIGIVKFIEEVAHPLGVAVGEKWFQGEMNVFIERYYSTQISEILNDLIVENDVHAQPKQPRILLGTLSGEKHILGLTMTQTLLCAQGAFCINLGAELPPSEFVDAVEYFKSNVVGFSFSPVFPKRMMSSLLRQLRTDLPIEIEIWVGGKGTQELEENIDGISIMNTVDEIIVAYQSTLYRLSAC